MNRDTETVPARHETPDLAELRRLAEAATPGPWEAFGAVDGRRGERWLGVTTDMRAIESARAGDVFAAQNCTRQDALFIAAANPATVLALLDAAAERDRLAGLLDEPRRSGCAVEIAGVRIAPCDERGQTADMRALDTAADRLDHMTEVRDNARAEVERLTAQIEAAIDVAHLDRQQAWSAEMFGPAEVRGHRGVLDHIRKELVEIEAEPGDVTEWADLIILAFDGAWRSGHSPADTIAAIKAKQERNEARTWPDWRTADPNKAIEHVRALDGGAES